MLAKRKNHLSIISKGADVLALEKFSELVMSKQSENKQGSLEKKPTQRQGHGNRGTTKKDGDEERVVLNTELSDQNSESTKKIESTDSTLILGQVTTNEEKEKMSPKSDENDRTMGVNVKDALNLTHEKCSRKDNFQINSRLESKDIPLKDEAVKNTSIPKNQPMSASIDSKKLPHVNTHKSIFLGQNPRSVAQD
eukprot:CAMPEP_0194383344 /NCGR_PEP_ID=MMETSP0174-20130528/66936_1 /TAXON_ID=216777 /ORGANISM="Proboscia alata, Strain PI-D3" /LENGTH=194 /DNA_ID=CAMNT_0039169503 /DNA_START=63 /DNA_END=648 /DNA_ORIENTATION=+